MHALSIFSLSQFEALKFRGLIQHFVGGGNYGRPLLLLSPRLAESALNTVPTVVDLLPRGALKPLSASLPQKNQPKLPKTSKNVQNVFRCLRLLSKATLKPIGRNAVLV